MSKVIAIVLEKAAALIESGTQWAPRRCGADAFSTYHIICQAARPRDQARVNPDLFPAIFFARLVGFQGNGRDGAIDFLNYDWDCAPERTQADVVAKLREAAIIARASAK